MHRTNKAVSVIEATDRIGEAVVHVPLANGGHATVDAEDYRRLMREGVSPCWTLNEAGPCRSYVRVPNAKVEGRLEVVARLLTMPGRGMIVKYSNGDRTNLRQSNLYLVRGRAPGQSAAGKRKAPGRARASARPPEAYAEGGARP
jgi:hypothetical protein